MWNEIIELMRFGEDIEDFEIMTDEEFEKRIRGLGYNIYSNRYEYTIKNSADEIIAIISKNTKLCLTTRGVGFENLNDAKRAELINTILDYSCTRGIGNVQE